MTDAQIIASEAEAATNAHEADLRFIFNGNAMAHLDFQRRVTAALVDQARMIRDLARIVATTTKGTQP